jgi:hypothetical protein
MLKKMCAFSVLVILALILLIDLVSAYDNSQYGFSITPPSEWETWHGGPEFVVRFTSYSRSAYVVGISVVVEETNAALMDYVSSAKISLAATNNFELVSEGQIGIGKLNAYEIVSVNNDINNDASNDWKYRRVFFVENGKAYLIRCDVFAADYDSFAPTFEQSIQTFRIFAVFPVFLSIIIIGIVAGVGATMIYVVAIRRLRKTYIDSSNTKEEHSENVIRMITCRSPMQVIYLTPRMMIVAPMKTSVALRILPALFAFGYIILLFMNIYSSMFYFYAGLGLVVVLLPTLGLWIYLRLNWKKAEAISNLPPNKILDSYSENHQILNSEVTAIAVNKTKQRNQATNIMVNSKGNKYIFTIHNADLRNVGAIIEDFSKVFADRLSITEV